MHIRTNLLKMPVLFENGQIVYFLNTGNDPVHLNPLIGKPFHFEYLQQINCIKCGKKTYKSFSQGFCYDCFISAPEADPGIINPELDQSHLGISRDMEWAKKYLLVPHVVYLAISSGLKVGVTRSENVYTRWIDQGAWKAIRLAETPYRNLAGQIEVALKNYYADKTNWRHMLTNKVDRNTNLEEAKREAAAKIPDALKQYISDNNSVTELTYPVKNYPDKIKSINFEKQTIYEGILKGIKGQYLIFEDNMVMNVRKYNGYLFDIKIGN